jgi:hypothetical protein
MNNVMGPSRIKYSAKSFKEVNGRNPSGGTREVTRTVDRKQIKCSVISQARGS